MDSAKLVETLKQIGYPGAEAIDHNAVDWIFENDSTKPFVNWFCNNVGVDNVITDQEIQEFSQLEANGQTLTGSHLKETLDPLADLHLDEDILKSDIEELKESLEKARARKELLMKRNRDLRAHHMKKENRLEKLRMVEDQCMKSTRQNIEQCASVNTKIDHTIAQLACSVATLTELYNISSKSGKHASNSADFLTQAEMKAYHDAEEKFSKDLTAFTKKQFFSGVAELTGEKETTQYSLLDVSASPDDTSADVVEEDSFHGDCQEFKRIQEIFPQSESARINALINVKKAICAANEARSILHLLKTDNFPQSAKEIRQLHFTAEQSISQAQSESTPLLAALPDLIQELAALQGTKILTGDYNLKLKRQDYFSANQEKVIEHLVAQRSRNELLSVLYEMEVRWHKDTHSLVSAARQTLEGHLLDWQQRMKELENPEFREQKHESSVVDVRDTSTARLHQMLDLSREEEKSLYLQTQKVLARAAALKSEQTGASAARTTQDEKYTTLVGQLTSCSGDLHSCLYSSSSTSRGSPALSSPQLQLSMTNLMGKLNTLEKNIRLVVENIKAKKTTLKNNVKLLKEREMFVFFHTNPGKLQYVVNGLENRAKAQQLNDS